VGAGALGHGFLGLGHDFRAGMGGLKPRHTIQPGIRRWRRLAQIYSANNQVGEKNGLYLAGEATARWFSSKNSFICGICVICG
jgi:hypothetical protein